VLTDILYNLYLSAIERNFISVAPQLNDMVLMSTNYSAPVSLYYAGMNIFPKVNISKYAFNVNPNQRVQINVTCIHDDSISTTKK
jgi:hypothetical protein